MNRDPQQARNAGYAMEIARQAEIDFSKGKFQDARDKFLLAHRSDPERADYLSNLAACHLELGDMAKSIASASNAIEIDARLAFAYVNRGDALRMSGRTDLAVQDYRKAVELEPENLLMLNKAGACELSLGQHSAARNLLKQALRIEPRFSLALLNLGMTGLSTGNRAHDRQRVELALTDQGLGQQAKFDAQSCLDIVDEHEQLQAAIDNALAVKSAHTINDALAQGNPELNRAHPPGIALLEALAQRCVDASPGFEPQPLPAGPAACFLEALTACELPDSRDSRNALYLDPGNNGAQDNPRNLLFYFRQCRKRNRSKLNLFLNSIPEATIRYWHARLLEHSTAGRPGQFKHVPNLIWPASAVPATPPRFVRSSITEALGRLYNTIPPGVGRALFLLMTLTQIQPFVRGNKRMAGFMFQWELASNGLAPIIIPANRYAELMTTMNLAFVNFDLNPVWQLLSELSVETSNRMEELSRIKPSFRFG